ncbi:MAG: hypothetical protein H6710_15295 [Myxococcales bacterium]|nr:hypothetical protein [Myxococcales bacterium]
MKGISPRTSRDDSSERWWSAVSGRPRAPEEERVAEPLAGGGGLVDRPDEAAGVGEAGDHQDLRRAALGAGAGDPDGDALGHRRLAEAILGGRRERVGGRERVPQVGAGADRRGGDRVRDQIAGGRGGGDVAVEPPDRQAELAPAADRLDERIGGLDHQVARPPRAAIVARIERVGDHAEEGEAVERGVDGRHQAPRELDRDRRRPEGGDRLADDPRELEVAVGDRQDEAAVEVEAERPQVVGREREGIGAQRRSVGRDVDHPIIRRGRSG